MSEGGDPQQSSVLAGLYEVLAPFNTKGLNLSEETSFTRDLDFDSLVVMEFIAAVEDQFDISVPMNILPDIETIGQLATAVEEIVKEEHG